MTSFPLCIHNIDIRKITSNSFLTLNTDTRKITDSFFCYYHYYFFLFNISVKTTHSFVELAQHPAIQTLAQHLDLSHTFGYIKLVAFPLADTPGVTALSAAEITTGMPQGTAATAPAPARPLLAPTAQLVEVVDGEKDEAGSQSSLPQVVSFEDVASLSLDPTKPQDTHRSVCLLPLNSCSFLLPLASVLLLLTYLLFYFYSFTLLFYSFLLPLTNPLTLLLLSPATCFCLTPSSCHLLSLLL